MLYLAGDLLEDDGEARGVRHDLVVVGHGVRDELLLELAGAVGLCVCVYFFGGGWLGGVGGYAYLGGVMVRVVCGLGGGWGGWAGFGKT